MHHIRSYHAIEEIAKISRKAVSIGLRIETDDLRDSGQDTVWSPGGSTDAIRVRSNGRDAVE